MTKRDGEVKCDFIRMHVRVCRGMCTIYLAAWDLKGMFIFRLARVPLTEREREAETGQRLSHFAWSSANESNFEPYVLY